MKKSIKSGLIGAVLTLTAVFAYQATGHVLNVQDASEAPVHMPVQAFEVDPSWVKEGKPHFRAVEFYQSTDKHSSSGIFECDGPSTFEWHYQLDEAIYVLEGGVEIDYQGKHLSVKPGETVFFRAGTTATWHVPVHIKKAWTLYDPGRVARWMAKLFG
ncbi:MAG: DUF861 domain-containing protein [Burkholderiales bacterium]|nr:DUF861 domain-containing protein [Burkholderiales bacterium]